MPTLTAILDREGAAVPRKQPKGRQEDKKPARGPRARDKGEVVAVGVEIDAELHAALEECVARTRRPRRAIIELALEAYLRTEGFWPRESVSDH